MNSISNDELSPANEVDAQIGEYIINKYNNKDEEVLIKSMSIPFVPLSLFIVFPSLSIAH